MVSVLGEGGSGWVLLRAGQSTFVDGMAQSRGRLRLKASASSERLMGWQWRSERRRRSGILVVARKRLSCWCRGCGCRQLGVNPGQGTCQAQYPKDTSFFLPQRETEVKDQGI